MAIPSNQTTSTKLQSGVTDPTGHLDVRSLMAETIAGKDPEQVAYGNKNLGINPPPVVDETDATEEDDTNTTAGTDTGEVDTQVEVTDQTTTADSTKTDIETVTLKMRDPKTGRQQKLQIDYADRAAVKKAYMEAAGMRKFQLERDQANKKLTDIQSKYDELSGVYSKLDEAFQKDGARGVIKLLGGSDKDAWKAAVDGELKHREYLSNLTPAEKFKLEAESRTKEYQDKLAAVEKRNQEFMTQVSERENAAAQKSLEAQLHPSFDRYRFAGKLGDPTIEHQFDEAVWNKVMTRLSEYPEDIELTQALIDREFREVSNNFRKMVSVQTEKAVKSTLDKKKADASERVQTMAKKGLSGNTDQKRFMENIQSGNVQEAFKAMFTGKVKL